MKKRVSSIVVLALLLASLLIGMQSNTTHAWEYDLGHPEPIAQ